VVWPEAGKSFAGQSIAKDTKLRRILEEIE